MLGQLRTQQEPVCTEHHALGVMQKSLERSVRIPRSKCLLLRMRRDRYASATTRMAHITHLIERCESIATCKSRTHRNVDGCQKCPVIFLKNEAMIRAIDRGNNLPVIVTIDYEMKLLQEEFSKQSVYMHELEETMQSLRIVMAEKLTFDMQAWYTCRMAYRKATYQHERATRSLYYFRIRKLVRMKKQLDYLNYKIPSDEELAAFEYTYSDLPTEASEYRRKLAMRKRYIENKYSRPMWEKLVKLYAFHQETLRKEANAREIARRKEQRIREEKRRRKMLKIADDQDDSEDAIKARLLEKMRLMENRRYICHYVDCHKREFKSQRRLDIHLNQHLRQRRERQKILEMHARNKQRREEEERVFLGRLKALRLLKCNLEAAHSMEEHHGPGRLKFLEYVSAPIAQLDNSDRLSEDIIEEEHHIMHADHEYGDIDQEAHDVGDWHGDGGAVLPDGESEVAAEDPAGRHIGNVVDRNALVSEQSEVEDIDDELDPFYDSDKAITFGATNNSMSNIDIFDDEFMNAMDRELFKRPGSSDDEEDLAHQYSMAEVIASHDYDDLLFSNEKQAFSDEIGFSPHEELFDEDDSSAEFSSSAVDSDRKIEDEDSILVNTVTDGLDAVELPRQIEDQSTESPPPDNILVKSTGLAPLKQRPPAADSSQQRKEIGQTACDMNSMDRNLSFADRFKKNKIAIPSSQSELRVSYIPSDATVEVRDRFAWMRQQYHIGLVFDNIRVPMKHLELLSKHPDVECPYRIPLVAPLVRMGTLDSNEVVFTTKGAIKKEGRVAKQHVVIYVPLHTEYKDQRKSALNKDQSLLSQSMNERSIRSCGIDRSASVREIDIDNPVLCSPAETIVDNHTIWGTYLVSVAGVRKVPTITSGYTQTLFSGDLLCIGVRWRGPETLSAVEASSAVMVYRVRCSADTNKDNL